MAAGVLLAPNEGVPPPAGANANGDDPVLVACEEKLKPPEAGGVGAAKLNPVLGPEEPNGVVIALAKREKEKWLIHGGKFTEVIRDLNIQRRARQRERQKNKRFNKQNNNFARASRFFVHFFPLFARLRRENA